MHIPGLTLDIQQLFLNEADYNAQMLTRSDVPSVPKTALRGLMAARPSTARAIVVGIAAEISISREWILHISRRDAQSRVANLLREFAACRPATTCRCPSAKRSRGTTGCGCQGLLLSGAKLQAFAARFHQLCATLMASHPLQALVRTIGVTLRPKARRSSAADRRVPT